jgi:predicted acylesterase/phospholipase RssA
MMQYDMVFEGGGAKGFAFVGVMQVLEALGHTPGRLLGTSAGAITATLLAAGYTCAEMEAGLNEQENGRPIFASFLATPPPLDQAALQQSDLRALLSKINLSLVPDTLEAEFDDWLVARLADLPSLRSLFSLLERGGWYSADNFVAWLRRHLNMGRHLGRPRKYGDLTLEQFYQATHADLSLVAADTTSADMLVLNHHTAPNVPVVWAARMSMSVPLLWQEVIWRPEWGPYNRRDLAGHAIVDGGLLSNFPIELFISAEPRVTAVMGPKTSEHVLGLFIDEDRPVPGAEQVPPAPLAATLSDRRIVQRLGSLVSTTLSARDRMAMETCAQFIIRLPAKGYGTIEFEMTPQRQALLVQAAHAATQRYFDNLAAAGVSFGLEDELGLEQLQQTATQSALSILDL